MEFLVLLALFTMLIAMWHLATRLRGPAAPQVQRPSSGLTQIALAMHNYHSDHGVFPPFYTTDSNGNPLHSWRTLLLPYLDEKELYEQIDLSKRWDHPANQAAARKNIATYCRPEVTSLEGHTNYSAIIKEEFFLNPKQSRNPPEDVGPQPVTLMLIEVKHSVVPWMSPEDPAQDSLHSVDQGSLRLHPDIADVISIHGHINPLPADVSP